MDGEGDGVVLAAEVDLAEGPPRERAVGADAGLPVFFFLSFFFDVVVVVVASVSIFLLGVGLALFLSLALSL